ncbi:MAG: hypothetical protein Q8Q14_13020 [Gemmatimonadales bacterium]|nr:hypothetical protein [Gemmatimonadales bacterium]
MRRRISERDFRVRLHNADFTDPETSGLRDALASPVGSVDELLELPVHAQLVAVGKAAIAATLFHYERPGDLLPDARHDDWYEYLFRRMKEGASTLREFLQNRVVFVTFNYDRSLEHFFFTALQSTYGAKPQEIAEAMSKHRLPIVHVYGSLGALPTMGGQLPYGVDSNITGLRLKEAAASIHIAGEPGAQAGIDAAQKALMSRERVCFLGFGYRAANVKRLELATTLVKETHVFGSAYDLLEGERRDVGRLFRAVGHPIALSGPDTDTLKALREFPVLSEFDLTDL